MPNTPRPLTAQQIAQRRQARIIAIALIVIAAVSAVIHSLASLDNATRLLVAVAGTVVPLAGSAFFFARCWSKWTTTPRLCGKWRDGVLQRCSIKSHRELVTPHDAWGIVVVLGALANAWLYLQLVGVFS